VESFLVLPPTGAQILLLALSIGAAVYDLRYHRIPNWLTVGGAVLGIGLNVFLGPRNNFGIWFALQGLALGFGSFFVLYILHATGAGDVKLMAAVGAIVGWRDWCAIFFLTALFGGAAAIVLAILRKRLGKTLWNISFILSELKSGRPAYLANEELDAKSPKALGVPRGVLLAVAAVVFLGWAARAPK
jgi:prepilin peptidase CpaA